MAKASEGPMVFQILGFRAFLGISGRCYGDFSMEAHNEIHIFLPWAAVILIFREILKNARNPVFFGKTTREGLR